MVTTERLIGSRLRFNKPLLALRLSSQLGDEQVEQPTVCECRCQAL
jgi:hypothetical protein